MWPFTGGCHFSDKCTGYEVGCERCPMLGDGEKTPVSAKDAAFKSNHINDNFIFVGISRQIVEQGRCSWPHSRFTS
jgi:hypothetical protein